jgi:iron complex transport system substrate-binding protein
MNTGKKLFVFGFVFLVLSNGVFASPVKDKTPEKGVKVIVNVDGTPVEVPSSVKRVAAIFGPSYEKIVLLGAEDKIVCDGDFHIDGWPWSNVIYKRLNQVPGIPNAHSNLNVEEMLGYDLDVVFNFPNPQTTSALREVGISVVPMAGTGKMADVKETLRVYAEALGDGAPARAARYAAWYDEKVKMVTDITSKIPQNRKSSVYMANQIILKTAGNKSDLVEVMQLAGGICVSADLEGNSLEITREQLMSWDPDFIFVDHAGSSGNQSAEDVVMEMVNQGEFVRLKAVTGDRVYVCPTGVFFWDSGVQKPLLLMWMAATMYPEYFPDFDLRKELKDFYAEFFDYMLTDAEADLILAHRDPPK